MCVRVRVRVHVRVHAHTGERVEHDHGPRPRRAAEAAEEALLREARPVVYQRAEQVEEHAPGVELHVLPMDGGRGAVLEQLLRVDAAERGEEGREDGEKQPPQR